MKEKTKQVVLETILWGGTIFIVVMLSYSHYSEEKASRELQENKVVTVGIVTSRQIVGSQPEGMLSYHFCTDNGIQEGDSWEDNNILDFLLNRICVIEYQKDRITRSQTISLFLKGDSVMSINESKITTPLRKNGIVYTNNPEIYKFEYLFSERYGKTVEECLGCINLDDYPKPLEVIVDD